METEPILQLYPQTKARDAAEIICNKEGAIALIYTLLSALVSGEEQHPEFYCNDAEAYFLKVVVNDTIAETIQLPYPPSATPILPSLSAEEDEISNNN